MDCCATIFVYFTFVSVYYQSAREMSTNMQREVVVKSTCEIALGEKTKPE